MKSALSTILLALVLQTSWGIQNAYCQGLKLVASYLEERSEAENTGLTIHGNLAFVGGAHTSATGDPLGVRIVDLSEPENPVLIGRIPLNRFSPGSSDQGGVVVLDLDTEYFKGTVAIVTNGVPEGIEHLRQYFGVWDVTDPANPEFLSIFGDWENPTLGNSELGAYPNLGMDVAGNYFYYIYDPSDFLGPRERRYWDRTMGIVDLSDPRNPVQIGSWQDRSDFAMLGLSVNKAGTRAYISGVWPKPFGLEATHVRFYVVDVSDPTDPKELGRWEMPERDAGNRISSAWIARPSDDDSIVILADGSWGPADSDRHGILHILDTSNPANITKLSEFNVYDHYALSSTDEWVMAHNVMIRGTMAYAGWMDAGAVAIDISDPANPELTGQFVEQWIAEASPLGDEYVVATPSWKQGLYVLLDNNGGGLTSTASEDDRSLPQQFLLHQNYPNPFNPSTLISFDIGEVSSVRLSVFDLLGKEVDRLVDGTVPAGTHRVRFDARDLPGGVYIYRLTTDRSSETRQAVLLR